ncbi:hypothetical protein PYW08_012975 [Mythimna loreyi]|uniref:Uncharacterized protein n=1 Tax=Mythimna loreyi TaxID=667449 RepID=A0ACC2PZ83_9NEOP|nr:hypothetical protein PYW08_012975 [Mythimna loreyi]
MFEDFQSKQEEKLEALKSTMDAIKKQNEEIKTSMIFLSDKYDEILSSMDKLQHENTSNRDRIKILEAQSDQFDLESRAGSVELRNIPEIESETKQSLINLTKNIGAIINTPIHDSDIRDVYRIKIKDK